MDTEVKTITLMPSWTFQLNDRADTKYVIMHKSAAIFMISVKENYKVLWKCTTRKHVFVQGSPFWEIIWSET